MKKEISILAAGFFILVTGIAAFVSCGGGGGGSSSAYESAIGKESGVDGAAAAHFSVDKAFG